jgi:uncharacterized membrane protein YfhO
MTLDVDAREPTVIATSTTSWAGWKLEIDGARAPLLNYNHAFLGFRVPRGRHTAVLFYRPNSFVAGLEVTLGTLVLSAWLAVRAWRVKGRRNSLS